MKGIIFNLFESFVKDRLGADAWFEVLEEVSKSKETYYLSSKTYPDEVLLGLVAGACRRSGLETGEAVRSFGRYCFPQLARRFPQFVDKYASSKSFLKTIDSVIHVEVVKLYPDARTPKFLYEDPAPDRLVLTYRSERKLCALAEGLLEGAGEWFRERLEIRHAACSLRGDPECRFEIRFESVPEPPQDAKPESRR